MILRDIIANAGGNLWRMKLRSILTIAGVVIAIAAFISMLSFGVGMQENVSEQFAKFGLFSILQVYPSRNDDSVTDTTTVKATLDFEAVTHFATIPGVNLAYPYDDFAITATLGDSVVATTAQALPQAAVRTRLYSNMIAGAPFSGDSSDEAVVTVDFLEELSITNIDSMIGQPIVVSAKVATIDSGLAHVFEGLGGRLADRLRGVWRDSLGYRDFWLDVGRDVAGTAMSRFMQGLLNARRVVTDTLRISGVMEGRERGRSRTNPIMIPSATAAHLNSGDFGDDPTAMLAALRGGQLWQKNDGVSREYPRVTLDLDPRAPYEPIRDSIRALGYRTFSYADEFKEIRKFFLYFNFGLSMVGIIALVTASLGIVNTMVMSILERTREIGVLKSLGADDRDIRLMFLVESGLIGTIGASIGIVFGWVITQVATKVAHHFMAKEGIPLFEPFSLPIWLILGALSFGLLVSLGAGLYPAVRASRVDPVEALRHD